jgi:hypothetical protein
MIQFHWDFAQKNKNGSVAILWNIYFFYSFYSIQTLHRKFIVTQTHNVHGQQSYFGGGP